MQSQQLFQIRNHCAKKAFRYTQHFMQRIIQRRITIEDYPDDYPYPSCLVLGYTINDKPLHVVCGITPDELFLITAYRPDASIWSADFTTRTTRKE